MKKAALFLVLFLCSLVSAQSCDVNITVRTSNYDLCVNNKSVCAPSWCLNMTSDYYGYLKYKDYNIISSDGVVETFGFMAMGVMPLLLLAMLTSAITYAAVGWLK